jgi:ribosomal protein L37E
MFCPKCSERQTSEETQFCSKCGFPATGAKIILENAGKCERDNQYSRKQISDFGNWKTTGNLFEPVYRKPKTSGELK